MISASRQAALPSSCMSQPCNFKVAAVQWSDCSKEQGAWCMVHEERHGSARGRCCGITLGSRFTAQCMQFVSMQIHQKQPQRHEVKELFVTLPAPLGPSRPKHSPLSTAIVRFFTACFAGLPSCKLRHDLSNLKTQWCILLANMYSMW